MDPIFNDGTVVAFDVDGTLIGLDGKPRYDIIDLYRIFERLGCRMIIWSGGGQDYAESIKRRLGLGGVAKAKSKTLLPDIAIDDEVGCRLGKTTFYV